MGIGKQLADLREKLGISQEELANRLEMARNYVSRIENDHVNPSYALVERILAILGIEIGSWLKILQKNIDHVEQVDKKTENLHQVAQQISALMGQKLLEQEMMLQKHRSEKHQLKIKLCNQVVENEKASEKWQSIESDKDLLFLVQSWKNLLAIQRQTIITVARSYVMDQQKKSNAS